MENELTFEVWQVQTMLRLMKRMEWDEKEWIEGLNQTGWIERFDQSNVCSLLMLSVSNGNSKVVRDLIQRGVNVKVKGKYGENPLMHALRCNEEECALLLLEEYSKEDFTPEWSFKWLSSSLSESSTNGMKKLIEKGCDLNQRNEWGETALMLAFESKSLDHALYLIKAGASLEKTSKKDPFLMEAIEEDHVELVQALWERQRDLMKKIDSCGVMMAVLDARAEKVLEWLIRSEKTEWEATKSGHWNPIVWFVEDCWRCEDDRPIAERIAVRLWEEGGLAFMEKRGWDDPCSWMKKVVEMNWMTFIEKVLSTSEKKESMGFVEELIIEAEKHNQKKMVAYLTSVQDQKKLKETVEIQKGPSQRSPRL